MYVYTNNELSGGCDADWNQAKEYGKNLDISNMLKLSGKHWWCASAIKRAFWSTFRPAMIKYAKKLGESGQLYKASKFKIALSSLIIPHPEVIKLFDDAFAETFVPFLKTHCYNYGKEGKCLESFVNDLNLYGYMSLVPLALNFYKKGKDARKNTGGSADTGGDSTGGSADTGGDSTGGSKWSGKRWDIMKAQRRLGVVKQQVDGCHSRLTKAIRDLKGLSIINNPSIMKQYYNRTLILLNDANKRLPQLESECEHYESVLPKYAIAILGKITECKDKIKYLDNELTKLKASFDSGTTNETEKVNNEIQNIFRKKIGIIKNTNTAKLDDIISKIATALNLSIENSSSLNALIKVSGKPPKVILHGSYNDMSSKLATALKSLTKKDVEKDDYIAYLSEDGVAYKIPFDFKNIDALKLYDSNGNLLKETPASFKELSQSVIRLEAKEAK